MKVLVVGGAGYIGSHVCKALQNQGFETVVFDNLSSGLKSNLKADVPLVVGDILNKADFQKLEAHLPFDGAIHLAALKAAGESMVKPEIYTQHNLTGTYQLLEKLLEWKVGGLVFSSSAAVYGSPEYIPLDEKHPLNPENYYGYTKKAIEDVLNWYFKLKGFPFAALRYFNAAGYDAEGFPNGLERNPQNLIPIIMEVAVGTREKMKVFGNDYATPDGTGVRDYIHVSDLAIAHVKALEYILKHKTSLTLNLGSETGTSVLEVIQATDRVTGKKIAHDIVERRPGDPAKLVASSKLAEKVLNWKATQSDITNLIETSYKAYLSNQKK